MPLPRVEKPISPLSIKSRAHPEIPTNASSDAAFPATERETAREHRGSGYLGTVISACLADFGTPVSCRHPDRSRINGSVLCCDSTYAAEAPMLLAVATGWPEFRALDFDRIKHLLKKPSNRRPENAARLHALPALAFEYARIGHVEDNLSYVAN